MAKTIYYSFPTNGTVHQSAAHKRVVILNAQTKTGFAVHRFPHIDHAYQTDTVWDEFDMKHFRERDQACLVHRATAEKIIGRACLRAHVRTLHASI